MKKLSDLSLSDLNQLMVYHNMILAMASNEERKIIKANMRLISAEIHNRIAEIKELQQIDLSI